MAVVKQLREGTARARKIFFGFLKTRQHSTCHRALHREDDTTLWAKSLEITIVKRDLRPKNKSRKRTRCCGHSCAMQLTSSPSVVGLRLHSTMQH